MKAVIVGHKKGGSYVLDRDGSFRFVRDFAAAPIGTEVSVPRQDHPRWQSAPVIATCLAFVLMISGFLRLWNTDSCSVFLDISVSLELKFNCFDQLIHISPIDEAAEEFLADLRIGGSPAKVIASLITAAEERGIMTTGMNAPPILISVFAQTEEASQAQMSVIYQNLDKTGLSDFIRLSTCDQDTLERALSFGVSPGRLYLAEELLSIDPTLSIDDVVNLSVDDLMTEIRQSEEEQSLQDDGDAETQPDGVDGTDGVGGAGDSESGDDESGVGGSDDGTHTDETSPALPGTNQ